MHSAYAGQEYLCTEGPAPYEESFQEAVGSVWASMGEDGGLIALKTIAVPTGTDTARMQSRLSNLLGERRMLAQLRHDCNVTFMGSALCEGYIITTELIVPGIFVGGFNQ
eukprot:TRINITY_DN1656_c0_g1_i2.p1 TRINITY_DN1656_c0_g1~~TRINITY_DN1656_c0_g1_i2.p1  ORF type:complete len:110 (+),score=9.69 TRINITY_DN1656_c0_g1_i2:131-460(+)